MHSIADEIEKVVKQELNDKKIGIEGYTHGGWVLIDFGDVVVHLFDDAAGASIMHLRICGDKLNGCPIHQLPN